MESPAVPLKNPHTDLLRLTPSELQHHGSSLKGTGGIQGETEVSNIKVRAEDSFLSDRRASRGHCSFLNPPPTEPQSWQADAMSETPSTWITLL